MPRDRGQLEGRLVTVVRVLTVGVVPATRSSILTVHILAGAHGLVAASGLARAFSIFLVMSHTRSFGLE